MITKERKVGEGLAEDITAVFSKTEAAKTKKRKLNWKLFFYCTCFSSIAAPASHFPSKI